MEIKDLLVDDGGKKIYATNQSDQVLVAFNDGGKKKDASEIALLNNEVNTYFFEYLESYNVPTYFNRRSDDKSFTARKIEDIPIIISVYNVASKSLADRFGLDEGKVLEFPVVELYFKDADKKHPMINEYHAYALGICERKDMTSIMRIATKVNAVLKSFFDRKQLKLINFTLQFGRANNQILLSDELTLDTINLWGLKEDGSFEKFSEGKDKDLKAYKSIKERILGGA